MFKPMNTETAMETTRHKALVYAFHGWGKTTQAAHMQRTYGKTFIISGESGLKSVSDEQIDFLPFTSWDGEQNPEKGVYSFRGIVKLMGTKEFQEAGYQVIFIDSLTELADRCIDHWSKVHEGNKNGFQIWGDYGSSMLGALKWVRDLPYHVVMTALAKEAKDDNGEQDYWPHIQGNAVQKQVGGIFDHVFCGVRITDGDRASPVVTRYIVTDEVRGWHGKVRDPKKRLKAVEKTSDIAELFQRLDMKESDYEARVKAAKTGDAK
jgi:hypothetical protein